MDFEALKKKIKEVYITEKETSDSIEIPFGNRKHLVTSSNIISITENPVGPNYSINLQRDKYGELVIHSHLTTGEELCELSLNSGIAAAFLNFNNSGSSSKENERLVKYLISEYRKGEPIGKILDLMEERLGPDWEPY